MNTVMLIGTLTRDPELKEMDKTKICDMRLVEANGRRENPLYIDVSTFGRQAEVCEQFLSKGRQVAICGQLRFREWENEDGSKRSIHTIAAEHIDFLTGNIGGGKGKGRPGRGGRSNGNGGGGGGREARGGGRGREGGGREARGRESRGREGGGREGGGRESRGREGRGRGGSDREED